MIDAWKNNLSLSHTYVLRAVFSFRYTFSAYIIDVYNGPALSLKSLQASALPEVASRTAVHINLAGVTDLY